MPVALRVEAQGFVDLHRNVGHLADTAKFALIRRINRERSFIIRDRARLTSLFNDRSGLLRSRIIAVQGQHDIIARVIADTDYAGYVHFGTRTQAARPFLTEADQSTQQQQIDVTNKLIRQSLERFRGGQRDIGAGFRFSRSL